MMMNSASFSRSDQTEVQCNHQSATSPELSARAGTLAVTHQLTFTTAKSCHSANPTISQIFRARLPTMTNRSRTANLPSTTRLCDTTTQRPGDNVARHIRRYFVLHAQRPKQA
jgi:hypothetical protein